MIPQESNRVETPSELQPRPPESTALARSSASSVYQYSSRQISNLLENRADRRGRACHQSPKPGSPGSHQRSPDIWQRGVPSAPPRTSAPSIPPPPAGSRAMPCGNCAQLRAATGGAL